MVGHSQPERRHGSGGNYGTDGVADDAQVTLDVFASRDGVCADGSFSAGSGGTEASAFTLTNINTGVQRWRVDLPHPRRVPDNNIGPMVTRPLLHEVRYYAGAVRGFLNTLGRTQQDTRTETNLASGQTTITNRYVMSNNSAIQKRNGIRCDATIPATGTITFIAILTVMGQVENLMTDRTLPKNTSTGQTVRVYADWAAMRPMTELEFEKACRGTASEVANEYVWGSTSITHDGY